MTANTTQGQFTTDELEFVAQAALFFEAPGISAKSLNWFGQPLEYLQSKLPETTRDAIAHASRTAIEKAFQICAGTLSAPSGGMGNPFHSANLASEASGRLHTGVATLIGGMGGFFGLPALPIELPISTLVMLRSILDIAQNYGNDLSKIETRLECMYVFSLGSKSSADDAIESAYYSSRLLLGQMIKNTATFIAGTGVKELFAALESGTAPLLVRLIAKITAQFEIRVTHKILLQTAPLIGSLGGAGINFLFAKFFQDCARFHFGIKRIEKEKGFEATHRLFEEARLKVRSSHRHFL